MPGLEKEQVLEITRIVLADAAFKARHRVSATAFTRVRCLPFALDKREKKHCY